jgi:O-antigen/teichoic acid export membrane protein
LGAKFFLIQIQVVILFQSTNFLISNLSGPNDVTYYNIAYKYLGIAMMLYNIILSPLWPAFTNAFTLNDYSWMKRIYYKMIRVYIVSVLVLLVMMSVSPIVYRLWIGEKCIIPIPMTVLVGIYLMIHTWDSLQVYIINGIGKVKLQTIITTIGLTLHLPMSYFLGKIIGLGVYGVISSMILITSFYSLVFTLQLNKLFTRKAFGIWNK